MKGRGQVFFVEIVEITVENWFGFCRKIGRTREAHQDSRFKILITMPLITIIINAKKQNTINLHILGHRLIVTEKD